MTDKKPVFVDDPHAPDIFADTVMGYFLTGGNVRITLGSYRMDHSKTPGAASRVVIGRLVMSLQTAELMQRGLADFIARVKAQAQTAPHDATLQ